jgi:transcriptional regulator with XRE-family HTH domain
MIKSAKQVGLTIKQQRTRMKLTQEQLASRLQVTSQAVSKWEKGESYPDIQQISSLCDVFGVSMDFLMNDSVTGQEHKNEFRVFETMENENCKVDISNISIHQNFDIQLVISNKTGSEVALKPDYFLMLDLGGNMIEPAKQNQRAHDGTGQSDFSIHKIPSFIPPRSQIQVTLTYINTDVETQLWINIPDFVSGKSFTVYPNAHKNHQYRYANISLGKNELIDFYNFHFVKGRELHLSNHFPKIGRTIIGDLLFEKKPQFYIDNQQLFEEEILQDIASSGDFVDWGFTKRYVQDPKVLTDIVKKNYRKIEDECAAGHCDIIKVDSFQDYMDQDIVEFIIALRARYAKNYSKWTLDFITDKNIEHLKKDLVRLDYIKNAELFGTKVAIKRINEIIRESDMTAMTEYDVLKMNDRYKGLIEQETMDFLLSRLPIDSIEALTKYKRFMSHDAWLLVKNSYFSKAQEALDTLKKKIQ